MKKASAEKFIPVRSSTEKVIPGEKTVDRKNHSRTSTEKFIPASIEKATPDRRSKYTIPASVEIYHPHRRSKKVFPVEAPIRTRPLVRYQMKKIFLALWSA